MNKKRMYSLALIVSLLGLLSLSAKIQNVEAPYPIITIEADGSISPASANITTSDYVAYTFNADINASIIIQRSNIVIDGDGWTLGGNDYAITCGLNLTDVSNVTIRNLNVLGFGYGIHLDLSSDSAIFKNNISRNLNGVYLYYSSNITVSGNNIAGNSQYGIWLDYSNENAILSNELYSNPSAGIYVYSSCDNIIQKNAISGGSDSQESITLWYHSHRNIVSENVLSTYWKGIQMGYSDYNRILNNTVSNTHYAGIYLSQICNNSIIANNVVSDNSLYGIEIREDTLYATYNVIQGNNITRNLVGIHINRLSGNVIYHNNFVDNTNQISVSDSANIWDDGVEGNYWSNYTGADANHDGIGDTPHVIDGNDKDYYPLMGIFQSFNTSLGSYVDVVSNSTIDSFQYFESNTTIRMHVSNMTANQTHGFCRIRIPYEVMSEPFTVTVDGVNPTYWNYTLYDNGTSRWIYFEYEHSTKEVVIIPEFPSFLILLLSMMATLLTALANRRRQTREIR